MVALACPQALGHDFHRNAVSEQQHGAGVAEVVQPDLGQLVLPQGFACLHDLGDESARVPLGVPERAVEVAANESGVAHKLEREQAAIRPVRPQGGDGIRVDIHHARLADPC
jgi:hypothetical protein